MKVVSLTEYLLYHLVSPSPKTGHPCPGVSVPSTLFYRWSQPYHYYCEENGRLKRLNQDRIDGAKVVANMGDQAIWLWSKSEEEGTSALPNELADLEGLDEIVKIEYLSKKRIGKGK